MSNLLDPSSLTRLVRATKAVEQKVKAVTTTAVRATTSTVTDTAKDGYSAAKKKLVNLLEHVPGVGHSKSSERVGPEFIHLKEGWTPQGQGYDSKRGQVLTSYYGEAGVMVSIQNTQSGKELKNARLGGLPGGSTPSHGGGLATNGDYVYLSDTRHLYVYRRSDIDDADPNGPPVTPSQVLDVPTTTDSTLVSNGSYMTVKGKYAYVGGYSPDGDGKVGAVWRYELDPKTGAFNPETLKGPIRAPDRAQGVTATEHGLIFTTGEKKAIYQPFTSTSKTFSADTSKRADIGNGLIDSYCQGLNVINGELWVTYESGSYKYRDNVDEPRTHIQRIPLDALDLKAAGLTTKDLLPRTHAPKKG